MSTGYKIFYGLCACIVLALFVLLSDIRSYNDRPDNVAAAAADKAQRDTEKLRFDREVEESDATVAMRRSPTRENIARWEAAKRAVYGPEWQGSWQEDIAQDQAAWARAHVERQAEQYRDELRKRPVVVVVTAP